MDRKRTRPSPVSAGGIEALEGRVVLSGTVTAAVLPGAEVAAYTGHKASTTTTLSTSPATLGQSVTLTATVRGPAASGPPRGSVNFIVQGTMVQSVPLTPSGAATPGGKDATSTASYTLTSPIGGGGLFFGKHPLIAKFIPSGSFSGSVATKPLVISPPTFTTLPGNVKVATVVPGNGTTIQSGQTASVMYTGYLAKNGTVFDDSLNDGGTPFSYTLGTGQVVPGFDAGTVGMKVGETRIIQIPPTEGYGDTSNGLIPPNSTLVFVVTLEAIT